ncbi:MAG: 2-succinyl-5-enolpyruvyl-6-hydroxy-3-cyclohexene-1-carboxylic-acid synthase [Chlamydiia bacterium]|nr:2-succinyl-5-enolpyruvyl-6-hydroxy-3-cyclohexene-1-carboxylic-acid synthase [Chlamydiia bacterium]
MSAFWIVDQLIQQGVDQFCISPGSRSTPLALAVAEHPKAKSVVHFDERGIGFYALGYGMGAKKAAAVIVTSGTAVGNLMPSVMEANHSFIPMIVLSADRPSELRDCSANQASDQVKLFGHQVRWQCDLPAHGSETYFRTQIAQATFYAAQNPPGPVQINCQFQEPFYPLQAEKRFGKRIEHHFPRLCPPIESLRVNARRGLVVIGRLNQDPRPILEMAERLRWPVFADILSQARLYPTQEQIVGFDAVLKRGCALEPDMILYFGERLVSKSFYSWHPHIPITHVSPYPVLQDPARRVRTRIQCDLELFCQQFHAGQHDEKWLSEWQKLSMAKEEHPLKIPRDSAVFLGNSMPIRDADRGLYPEGAMGFYCNRGLSGIDGNIATAAGLAEGLQKPVVAWIGDQACLHDLNSLPLLKKGSFPVQLVVENNYGGQIFTRFPVSQSPHFEKFWLASHQWGFAGIAQMFDLPFIKSETLPEERLEVSSMIEWTPACSLSSL